MVKADATVPEVSAASILAKVTRDREMVELSALYPQYGFEGHKGYGSVTHIEAIRQYGYCEIHRKTFKLKALQPSLF
jgi:ribonuclease HII